MNIELLPALKISPFPNSVILGHQRILFVLFTLGDKMEDEHVYHEFF